MWADGPTRTFPCTGVSRSQQAVKDLQFPRQLNLKIFPPSDKWGAHRDTNAWLHRMAPNGESKTGYHISVRSYIFI